MKNRERRNRRAVLLAMLALSSLVLSGCTAPADAKTEGRAQVETPFPGEISDRLDAALAEAMTLSGSSGAIAGVWAPWSGQWVVASGTTAPGGTAHLTTDMRFRIAAITKSMTCTVLLKLVDEDTVKLSDPVSVYLPRIADLDGVTLGQLCQNTSGIADYRPGLAAQFVNNPKREWPPLEVVSSGLASDRLGAPGSVWSDSNTGFVLLGMALQSATNRDWSTLYRHYIFEPLGMADTSFPNPDSVAITGPHPQGFAAALDPAGQLMCDNILDETELSNSMLGVAGGVVSTVGDVKTWAQALAGGTLVSKKSAERQWATVPLGANSASWESYGLGVQQVGPLRGNAGAIPGFLSAMLSDPASGLTVVVMLNNSNAGAGFAEDFAQRLSSIASKAPASGAEKAPLLELPWSEEQMVQAMQAAAVCQPAPEPAPAG
jgi:D-alanyl-D-alanine carboxypeptidase